ncbi:uncharacterized protein HHUB_6047 (plasmid) [Halobacterium hubeiense]|uniref:DUF7260 domain-containing protein n=1 Tax=Halobacterium hubeiense TaxID=1407499 RepID=A0A0U5AKU5_9EURY|nr:hypothetical protein [Halobacterium hubeiense]CQH65030.1 uncharacterized protein HHUB_6047 [Halobacterium hubeiense]
MTLAQGSWPTYTDAALDSVRQERREVERECRAFQRFRQRIQTVDTRTPRFERSVVGVNQNLTSEEKPVRDTIEPWYRDTVMAVDHYGDVYGDSFEASISAEFGVDVLVLISEATTFSPLIKQRLLETAQQCIDNRRVFLETLEDEFHTLKDAQSTVQEIREAIAEFDSTELQGISDTELTDRYDTLHTLSDECKSWIQQRQEEIHAHRINRSADVDAHTDLCSYLYEGLEVDYPVLATFVDILEIISQYE